MADVILRFPPEIGLDDRRALRHAVAATGLAPSDGMTLSHRGPILDGILFIAATAVLQGAADGRLAVLARSMRDWLRGRPEPQVSAEIVHADTGLTIRIQAGDRDDALDLLTKAAAMFRSDRPLRWQGERWAPEAAARPTAVVVTALGVEAQAVVARLKEPAEQRSHLERDGSLYEVGTFAGDRGEWHIAVVEAGPGQASAALAADRAHRWFAPEVTLFVGIAGGLKDVRHGDVVAADAVYDYEEGKESPAGYMPRIKTRSPSHRLLQHARRVARQDAWQRRVPPLPSQGSPKAVIKPVAAGGKVVAEPGSSTADLIRRFCGDAVAVDTESHGFLHGAYTAPQSESLVVRGISDLLGDKTPENDEFWQSVAARHAAAFAFEVLESLQAAS